MADPSVSSAAAAPQRQGWFGLAYLVIFVAGIGFFVLSFVALGVLPGLQLKREMASGTADIAAYSEPELRGRKTYVRLGCPLCHTQQVRFLPSDVRRWGPPTEAWETRDDFPHLWGTRRIGPDLARETGVRSADWQLSHLYNPQSVVPGSAMAPYPWLFDGSPARPGVAATDLLAYLNTLGRARQSASGAAISKVAESQMDPNMMAEIERLCGAPFVNPSQALVSTGASNQINVANSPGQPASPGSSRQQLQARGALLFAQNCAGCHGAAGDVAHRAATGLLPQPANLRESAYSSQGLASTLWNGVAGSSMPAWRQLPDTDLASLMVFVQTLHQPPDEPGNDKQLPVLARGASVYAVNCVSCHGIDGDGNGPAARALLPRPADFRTEQPDTSLVQRVLNEGVPGTAMPAWPGLAAGDRQTVAVFVRSLYLVSAGAAN